MEYSEKYNKILKPFKINPKNKELYLEALTHSSYANEKGNLKDYQRLEYMGDAVFQIISAEYIYLKYPEMQEGEMTKLRISLVREESLALLGKKLNLASYMRLGHGEEKTRGQKDSIIADCVEAFLGAIYFDHGYNVAKKVGENWLKQIQKMQKNSQNTIEDSKSKLQELIQSDSREPLQYEMYDNKGKDNHKTFYCHVLHNNIELGKGMGHSKKEAEQDAAKDALSKMAK